MIAKQDRPLFFLLCVIAALLLALLVLPGALVVVQFNAGDGCNQPTFGCFLYRWQTLIGGSFAIVAAVIAWTNIERQRQRDKLYAAQERLQQLETALKDIQFIQKTSTNIIDSFSKIYRVKGRVYDPTEDEIRECFRQTFLSPRFHELYLSSETRYQIETVNSALLQFKTQTRMLLDEREHQDVISDKIRNFVARESDDTIDQIQFLFRDLEKDIATVQREIKITEELI